MRAEVDSKPALQVAFYAQGVPPLSQVFVYAGFGDPNLRLLCGRIHTDGFMSWRISDSDRSGTASRFFNLPQPVRGPLLGLAVTAQAIAFNKNLKGGAALSHGIWTRFPRRSGRRQPFPVKRIIALSSTATVSTGNPAATGVATRFN